MRRLAILFAIIALLSAVESIVLSETGVRMMQTRVRIRRAFVTLRDWRAFLIRPLRLFQRATGSSDRPWLNPSN